DNDTAALRYCEAGLTYHPASSELLLKKVRILNNLRHYKEAYAVADSLLLMDPKNSAARSLAESIKNNSSLNKVGVSYDYVYFDKNYPSSAPWQLVSLEYSRQTKLGSVIGFVNYANRFHTNGVQAEINAYPHISNTFYCYIDGGYSNNLPVFPTWRGGFSLYANLPKSFEGEVGFRYLYFSSATWIYTASVGKYYKDWWFNLRTYLVPENPGLSNSYTLTARYYFGGADDYLAGSVGTGISPDDKAISVQLSNKKLMAQKLSLEYRRTFQKLNIFYISVSYIHEEIKEGDFGNQSDIGIGYQRRF
ncbi:MAG: YaiO family outer membrane beta-barrel protein, partial [Chitinophagaceae bacterium]